MSNAAPNPAAGTSGIQIRITLSQDGNQALCEFPPRGSNPPINGHWLKQQLHERGFGEMAVIDDNVADLVELFNGGESGTSRPTPIAERRDASVQVRLSDDKMRAFLYTTPSQGGTPLNDKMIFEALMRAGVVYGVLKEEFPAILAQGQVSEYLIAEGRDAVRGEDTRFESLIPEAEQRRPTICDRGKADYRELGSMVMVKPGDAIVRRVPATPGTNGQNVLGQAILAEPGKDIPFAAECEGVAIDDYDENILIATIPGQPKLIDGGAVVEQTFRVKNVDLKSGNLAFDGSIKIDEDVKVGMRVRATGDVNINGSVEAAIIESGGDIYINGGVIGYGEVRDANGTIGRNTAQLKAKGKIVVNFIQNAIAEAAGPIEILKMAAHSELTSNAVIKVGKEGSKTGNIMGGIARALTLIEAQTLGSPANATTRLEVGVDPHLQEQLDELEAELEPKKDALTKIVRLITQINEKPAAYPKQTKEKAQQTFQQLKLEIGQLGRRREQLRTRVQLVESARIIAKRQIHGGVEMRIGDAIHLFTHDVQPGEFCLQGEEVARMEEGK